MIKFLIGILFFTLLSTSVLAQEDLAPNLVPPELPKENCTKFPTALMNLEIYLKNNNQKLEPLALIDNHRVFYYKGAELTFPKENFVFDLFKVNPAMRTTIDFMFILKISALNKEAIGESKETYSAMFIGKDLCLLTALEMPIDFYNSTKNIIENTK